MSALWNTLFYQPIYNILVFIINHITFGDVGFAIILVTIIVKSILIPLNSKSIRNQVLMKKMEPELKKIKIDFPDKEEQAKKTLEIYKKYKTNPFSGCLVVLIQLPIIFALYYVFYNGLTIKEDILYSFVQVPTLMHTNFLGLIEMGSHSVALGIFAGITQFIQAQLSSPTKLKKHNDFTEERKTKGFQDQLADSMQLNVKYILPIFVGFISWRISAAVALYWTASNIFNIVQEWLIRRKLNRNLN